MSFEDISNIIENTHTRGITISDFDYNTQSSEEKLNTLYVSQAQGPDVIPLIT